MILLPTHASNLALIFVLACALASSTYAQKEVDPSRLEGKVMTGYQGWFTAPGSGRSNRWIHWTHEHDVPNGKPGNLAVEMYPDLREFDADELMPTDMTLAGTAAPLYAASHPKTVSRHVRWMREYGIDGAFIQRFLRSHDNSDKDYAQQLNQVLWTFRQACTAEGRVFAVMYDVSGLRDTEDWISFLKNDWMTLVDGGITGGGRYVQHHGRPVVGVWGFGFADRVPQDPELALGLIHWFQTEAPEKYRASVLGGVPGQWRTLDGDSRTAGEWQKVYRAFDILSPWTVGRFNNRNSADQWNRKRTVPDLAAVKKSGQGYGPVIWPGFSWKNLKDAPANQIPREGGRFFWRQIYNATAAGASWLYVAMFDEVDEGTAIYKVAECRTQVPEQGFWLTLDADGHSLPSDWYLRLAGEAGRMLRRESDLKAEPDFFRNPGSDFSLGKQTPSVNP